jgi:nitrate reductase beta subunit
VRYVGYFFPDQDPMSPLNQQYNVNKLIYKHQVAMQLHPEFGTEPNLYYVPPLSAPTIAAGAPTATRRIPVSYLAQLFGDNPIQTPAERELRITGILNHLEMARTATDPDSAELRQILTARSEADRLQLNLPIP